MINRIILETAFACMPFIHRQLLPHMWLVGLAELLIHWSLRCTRCCVQLTVSLKKTSIRNRAFANAMMFSSGEWQNSDTFTSRGVVRAFFIKWVPNSKQGFCKRSVHMTSSSVATGLAYSRIIIWPWSCEVRVEDVFIGSLDFPILLLFVLVLVVCIWALQPRRLLRVVCPPPRVERWGVEDILSREKRRIKL